MNNEYIGKDISYAFGFRLGTQINIKKLGDKAWTALEAQLRLIEGQGTKTDEFSENFKTYVAVFGTLIRVF